MHVNIRKCIRICVIIFKLCQSTFTTVPLNKPMLNIKQAKTILIAYNIIIKINADRVFSSAVFQ